MQFPKSFKKVVIFAVVISVVNFLLGVIMSYFLALPTGATVVMVNLVMLIVVAICRWMFRL